MRGWIILIGTLLVGAALGVAGTIYVPPRVDPYLPKELRLRSRVVEGQVLQKQRDGNRVLVKVQTDQGVILAAFSKRRHCDLQNVEPEKKIFAELARRDSGLEINVCKRDEPGFDAERFRPTEPLKGALLQDAQQFCLPVGREGSDFIENDGASAAKFEAAEFAFDSPGESTAFVAEEFAFDEIGRKRGAVDF